MGTNFYTKSGKHIGKRSAAGLYCWSCMKTLCPYGEAKIHETDWDVNKCPSCGRTQTVENNWGAVGLELGFNQGAKEKKAGVQTCSSFTWAMPPENLRRCNIIVDEYDREMTRVEFLEMLRLNCPVEYFNSIGSEFS